MGISTFGSLNTVVSGLQAQQTALNTVGHNIANASTEGYSRQRVNLVTAAAQRIYTGGGVAQMGMGVKTQSIIRVRDIFIDRQFWKENSILGNNEMTNNLLTKIEDVFGEPGKNGLRSIMDTFWSSLNNLSTDASDTSARAVVIQNGVQLCTAIDQKADQLMNMVSDINVMVKLRVDTINQLTDEILALNKQIAITEAGKMDNANDLRDRRDYLVDQLSYIMDIQVTEDESGAYLINGGGGITLVTDTSRTELSTISRMDPDYNYEIVDVINPKTGEVLKFRNGEMAGLIDSRDSSTSGVKKFLNDLADISKFLLQEFNDVHKAGIDLNENQGGNFFGVPGVNYNDASYASTMTKGDWLANLKVSDELTDPTTGTSKVAVRTLLGEIKQSNPQSGHAIISGNFTGVNPGDEIEVIIKNASLDGTVLELEYTINGVTQTCTPITNPDTGSITFSLDGTGLTIQIARVPKYNTAGSAYSFTIPSAVDPVTGATIIPMQGIAAGDNAVNLCNRLKKDISSTIGDSSLDTYYSSQMGVLGVQAQTAKRLCDNQQVVVDQLQTARESVCGINEDEELTDMIRFQKAYTAAARVLTAMDEMLDKLINGTGRVGL